MKKLTLGLVLIALAACSPAKETDAVDSSGLCKGALIDTYHSTNAKIDKFKDTKTLNDLSAAYAACVTFKAMMSGQSCEALDQTTGAKINVNEDSLDRRCNAVKTIVSAVEESQKVKNQKPASGEDQKPVKEVPRKRSK